LGAAPLVLTNQSVTSLSLDIQTLTKEITVIDKESDAWKAEPLWVRYQFAFVKTKTQAKIGEYSLCILGLFLGIYWAPEIAWVAFAGAYLFSKLHHRMDMKKLW
jgi:hypothetical protein